MVTVVIQSEMAKTKVLVIEDEIIIAMDLENRLQKLGYMVAGIAASGKEAIQAIESKRPELVLMDIVIRGDIDGIDTAGIIKEEFDIPVVFLTAHSDPATLKRARITQPFGYLLKPFDDRELQSNIEIAIYKHQIEKELKENRAALRRANRKLEDRVKERTIKLSITNQQLNQEIIKRKKVDEALSEERQRRLSALIDGQELERRRLSRELHDGLGQVLVAVKHNVETLIMTPDPKTQKQFYKDHTMELISDAISEVKRISYDLLPTILNDFGLSAALEKMADRLSEDTDINISFYSTDMEGRMKPDMEINFFRIAQEAVNNAVKYSNPKEIQIQFIHNKKGLKLSIKDDGKGFDVEKLKKGPGHGLFNMHERASVIAAKLTIVSQKDRGTSVVLQFPIPPPIWTVN